MHIYSIYSKNNQEDLIIIRSGYSFIAGIFSTLWAIYNRMWLVACLSIAAYLINDKVVKFSHGPDYFMAISYMINISIFFIFTFFAEDLKIFYAQKRGYSLDDIVLASNEIEAEVKFTNRSSESNIIENSNTRSEQLSA